MQERENIKKLIERVGRVNENLPQDENSQIL